LKSTKFAVGLCSTIYLDTITSDKLQLYDIKTSSLSLSFLSHEINSEESYHTFRFIMNTDRLQASYVHLLTCAKHGLL